MMNYERAKIKGFKDADSFCPVSKLIYDSFLFVSVRIVWFCNASGLN